ncbi:hypothetical protein [Peristeroidobacter agariperforans]|uniref:hypothetical protein n=1 Tax=Peristeroidobacter agariperforans TaxID=268404 RepID=UPI00101B7DFD|nr:hypothetical protein [Peristeroidobacter agariperforans]
MAAIGVAVFAAGCGTVKGNLTPATAIDPTEGIVVSRTSCGSGIYKTEWYPAGVRSKGYFGAINFAFVLGCNNGLLAYAVPEGTYFMGKVVGMTYLDYPESDTWSFTVKAGQLNYVGDFVVPTTRDSGPILVAPTRVYERSAEARQELKAKYPWLAERFEFVMALAQRSSKDAPTQPAATP